MAELHQLPVLHINLIDIAIVDASDQVREILCTLGQDPEQGYRKALAGIAMHRNCGTITIPIPNVIEQTVSTLNVVVLAAAAWKHTELALSFDTLCDLCAFFIERIRHQKEAA